MNQGLVLDTSMYHVLVLNKDITVYQDTFITQVLILHQDTNIYQVLVHQDTTLNQVLVMDNKKNETMNTNQCFGSGSGSVSFCHIWIQHNMMIWLRLWLVNQNKLLEWLYRSKT